MLEEIFEKANNLALPSLQDIALTEITISLCKQRDLKNLIRNCNYHKMIYKQFPFEVHKEWKSVHYRAVEKLSKFCIPSSLKTVLLSRLWQISLEISRWIDYHTENLYLHIEVPKDFCWTNHGQIDKRKTAEMIIKDEYVCIKKRFKLACIYCLEDDIHALWENMRRTTKKCFYNPKDPRQIDQHGLVLYWAYHIQETPIDSIMYGDFDELTEYYAFFYAATEGNRIATEYFFKKLSEEQKRESLIRCVKAIDCGALPSDEEFTNFFEQDSNDVIYFLLSNMHQEDQLKAFENCSLTVLKSFLSWPRQKVFADMVDAMWNYVPKKDFGVILLEILSKDLNGYRDYNYIDLFIDFWENSPKSYKKFVNTDTSFGGILLVLLLRFKIPFVMGKKKFSKKSYVYQQSLKSIFK